MSYFHGTTILAVRRDGRVALGGDGQVTIGDTVMKSQCHKVRALKGGKVLAGFAGSAADAFTLFEKFEEKLERYPGNLPRAAVELAKDWRSDRVLRRLEALLVVADREHSFLLTGTGELIEPDDGIARDRLGRHLRARRRARAAGRSTASAPATSCSARWRSPATSASTPTGTSRFSNCRARSDHDRHRHQRHPRSGRSRRRRSPWLEELTPRQIVAELDRYIVGQDARQEGGRHRAAQPLAPGAGAGRHPRRDLAEQHHPDRPHRRREDRDRAPPRAARRRAVHQGRGLEVHRGRLRRPRRRSRWCATSSTAPSTWCAPSARTRS